MLRNNLDYHNRITELMKQLGYSANDDGVCYGIAIMAIQACVAGDIAAFNERLTFIMETKDLPSEIEAVKKELASVSKGYKDSKNFPLSEYEENILDVIAFFDGIELIMRPELHTDLFGKTISHGDGDATTLEFITSNKLSKQGGLQEAMSWPGIYNEEELTDYFDVLDDIAESLEQPLTFQFTSDKHSIGLHYTPAPPRWYMIDANQLPIQEITTDLATWVKSSLIEKSNITAFETSIYLSDNSKETKAKLNAIVNASTEFDELHQITNKKAGYQTVDGVTLAFLAARKNRADVIVKLHNAGADLNAIHNDSGSTPLLVAAAYGHAEAVNALINAGANLNISAKNGCTPAFMAANNGHAEVVRILSGAKADLYKPNDNGATPAVVAAYQGHASVLKVMGEAGMNLEGITPLGTPMKNAQDRNKMECVKVLQEYALSNKKYSHARLFSDANDNPSAPSKRFTK